MPSIEFIETGTLFEHYSKVFAEYDNSLNPLETHSLLMNTCMHLLIQVSHISWPPLNLSIVRR